MADRKKAEQTIITYIDKIAGAENKKLYKNLFKDMSNKDFDNFMRDLRDKKIKLSVIVPNGSDIKLDTKKCMKITEELGEPVFQSLRFVKKHPFVTPNKYLVLNVATRRASQILTKKISIPKDDKTIDLLTGQVTGESKASKLTLPELQILVGMGIKESAKELMKDRGGDLGAKDAMTKLLIRQGSVSQKVLENYATGVVSTNTVKAMLHAMMIRSNL